MIKEDFLSFQIKSTRTGCTNALTDDQLEAMFTVTDQEVREIEQLMGCLIEKTNHKCKRCTRFFSNETALKQHHCEPTIKNEKWSHYCKAINHAIKLEKRLRSCEKAITHPAKQQLHQKTINGPTSSKNGPSTPKKLMV